MTEITIAGVRLRVAARTDPGLKRAANEDSYLADGPVFVVADGMGGYECGDLASAAVVEAFRDGVAAGSVADFEQIQRALLDADERVGKVAAATQRGAGSTATGAALVLHDGNPYWLVFNVGDSRVYRHLGTELEQVTTDHSLGRELVDSGRLAPEDLTTFSGRNVVTRALGAEDSLADSWLVPVVNGERLMLCSDGLYGEVDDESIRATLTMTGGADAAVKVLVEHAKAGGGRDNITVIVIDIVAGGQTTSTGTTAEALALAHAETDDTRRI
jgi:PPM family protein phosphatase